MITFLIGLIALSAYLFISYWIGRLILGSDSEKIVCIAVGIVVPMILFIALFVIYEIGVTITQLLHF